MIQPRLTQQEMFSSALKQKPQHLEKHGLQHICKKKIKKTTHAVGSVQSPFSRR